MASASAEAGLTEKVNVVPFSEVTRGYTSFRNGDILVAKVTPCFQNGKTVEAVLPTEFGFGSTEFHVVRPIEGKASARYLLHFLRQQRVRVQGEASMTGTGGQRRVPARFFQQLEIPAPPLAEQRRIADILDRADDLRAKRQAAIDKLDSLTQAIFHEMFGDPRSNHHMWERARLGDHVKFQSGYAFPASGFVSSMDGTPVARIRDVSRGFATTSYSGEFDKKFLIDSGALLIAMTGEFRIGQWKGGRALLNQRVSAISSLSSNVCPEYIASLLAIELQRLERSTASLTVKNLSVGALNDLEIPVPDILTQDLFCVRLERLAAVTHRLDASESALGDLGAGLQQRAFNGAL